MGTKHSKMAPKKKKGKGKKGAAKEVSPKEQELKRFQTENELLKLQVAKEIGLSRRAQADREGMREELLEAVESRNSQKKFGNDVALSLTRNLQQLQAEKSLSEHDLKNQIDSLLRRIETLELQLENEKEETKKICSEKDDTIRQLQSQVDSMEQSYQTVLSDSFSSLSNNISKLKVEWEEDSLDYLKKYGSMLLDFGLRSSVLRSELAHLNSLEL